MDQIEAIAALLRLAGAAHGEYETKELGGVYDQEWPAWYAAYLVEHGLPALFGGRLEVARLATILKQLDGEHRAAGGSEPWPEFYAYRLPGMMS